MSNCRKIPPPLSRQPNPHRLFTACGVRDFNGTFGVTYECPLCHGYNREATVSEKRRSAKGRKATLRMYPTLANDFAVHCHNCGYTGNGLNLFWRTQGKTLDRLKEIDLFDGAEPDEGWIERCLAWNQLEPIFEHARARIQTDGSDNPYSLGEVGRISREDLARQFEPIGLLSAYRGYNLYLRIVRTLHGLPSYVAVDHLPGKEIARYYFHPPGPVELVTQQWCLYQDWGAEFVLTTDHTMACDLKRLMGGSLGTRPIPFAWASHCEGEIHEEIPPRLLHYLASPSESGEFALAFSHSRTDVRVRQMLEGTPLEQFQRFGDITDGESDAITFVADRIIKQTESDAHAISFLDAILAKPWVPRAAGDRLTAELAKRIGKSFKSTVELSGATSQVLSYVGEHATFLCRNGIYLKSSGKRRLNFQPCSNFSLYLERSTKNGVEILSHRVQLRMGPHQARFEIKAESFLDGRKLMKKAQEVALAERWEAAPTMSCHGGVALLPSIVLGTQQAPSSEIGAPAVWGFSPGKFRGPDYVISWKGMAFQDEGSSQPPCTRLLSLEAPESDSGDEKDYLKWKAHELASWAELAPIDTALLVGVLVNAALCWLHRGARGLRSFLALPTQEHLSVFSTITGIQAIQVGRAKREQQGIPRVMDSSYWDIGQFQRQGRIVAAIEDPDHRLNAKVMCLVHHIPEGLGPIGEVPSSLLGLLCYSVLGTKTRHEALLKLLELIDDPEPRQELHRLFVRSQKFFVQPDKYLETFIKNLGTPPPGSFIEQSGWPDHLLLKREVIPSYERRSLRFDIQRLGHEIRVNHFTRKALTRYGRERIPVLAIPKALFRDQSGTEEYLSPELLDLHG